MKPLFDIFSKSKTEESLSPKLPKEKITIDYREKNSLVASELIGMGFQVEFRELKVADYITQNTAIERKTINDFISSMINKRLLRQLEEIQQYENRLLIVEGIYEQELYNDDFSKEGVHPNAIRGFLLSILLKHKVPIIFSKDYKDTAKFISVLARKKEKPLSLNATKKSLNKKEQMQYIIESFPGIGPKTAQKLLQEFKSIKQIINTPLEKLQEILGKKADIFKIAEDEY